MKKIILSIFISTITLTISAQLDRSIRPSAVPAKKIELAQPSTFTLNNGLKIIVVENHKRPTIAFNLSLNIDPFMEREICGNNEVTGELLKCGTTTRTKAQIDQEIDFIGSSLNSSSSGIYASSLSKHTEKMMEIVADILLNPTFPEDQLTNIKNRRLTEIMANSQEPGYIAQNIIKTALYGSEHPYGEIMTAASIQNTTQTTCKNYYNSYFKPNIATLVIVGDITPKEAQKLTETHLSKWEKGIITTSSTPFPAAIQSNKVLIGNKEGGNQSSINLTYAIDLKPNSEDRIKATLMNEILGGGSFQARLFQNLREKRAFTYGAYSDLNVDKYVGNFSASADVRLAITDSAFTEIIKEMNTLQTELVTNEQLQLVKNSITGSFGRSMEDPATIARFELNIDRYNLPADYYTTYLQKVEAVTPEDIKAMAQKYLKPNNAFLVAVGDSATLTPMLKKLSPNNEIEYYDYEGKKK